MARPEISALKNTSKTPVTLRSWDSYQALKRVAKVPLAIDSSYLLRQVVSGLALRDAEIVQRELSPIYGKKTKETSNPEDQIQLAAD